VADVLFKGGVDYMTASGAIDGPYALASFKLETTNVQTGVPIMVWRSVGDSHTEFARESAIDELAAYTGRDPVDLRRDLLAGNPRTLRAGTGGRAGRLGNPTARGPRPRHRLQQLPRQPQRAGLSRCSIPATGGPVGGHPCTVCQS
jgi:isoquinoline 1-oxidoreductase subunit beta